MRRCARDDLAAPIDPPGTVRYLVLYGSHAHGTATEASDEDWRGVYQLPNDEFLGLRKPFGRETWQATKDGMLTAVGGAVKWQPDVVLWELGHFCRMLLAGNPNIVGLLSAPEDCIADICPIISILRDHRLQFVTRQMATAYLGWIESEMRHRPEVLTPKRLSHVVRLIYEMEGAAETGTVPVRLDADKRDEVILLKRGLMKPEAPTLESRRWCGSTRRASSSWRWCCPKRHASGLATCCSGRVTGRSDMARGDYVQLWLEDLDEPIVIRATKIGRRVVVSKSNARKWMTVSEVTRNGGPTGNVAEAQTEHVRAVVVFKRED